MKNKLDHQLFVALLALPRLPFPKAVKQDKTTLEQKREEFLKSQQVPTFHYSRASEIEIEKYLEALKKFEASIEQTATDENIKSLYRGKLQELRTRVWLIRAISQQDDQLVTRLSLDLFGPVRQDEKKLHREFDEMLGHAETFIKPKKIVDAKMFAEFVRKTLDYYGMQNWRIKTTSDSSISVGHSFQSVEPIIRIPKKLLITKQRAARLLTHEIEVHALRTNNGAQSPLHILERGLDRYLQTEEGLAIYFQSQLAQKPHHHAPGFWDAWTIALTKEHGFADVFNTIFEAKAALNNAVGHNSAQEKALDSAWRLCLRAYRGIANPAKPGVGFWRDHIYRSGLKLINDLKKEEPQLLEALFVGNIGVQHLKEISALNLPQAQTPELISRKIVGLE